MVLLGLKLSVIVFINSYKGVKGVSSLGSDVVLLDRYMVYVRESLDFFFEFEDSK